MTQKDRRRVTLATAALSGLALNLWAQGWFSANSWVRWVSIGGAALLALVLAVTLVIARTSEGRWGAAGQAARLPADLVSRAGQAEQWLVALGTDARGMAAAEWFRQEEPELRRLVARHATNADAVEELAHICDALDQWYVRERRFADLVDLAERLATVADHAGRRDLKELAAIRTATGHRLAGEVEEASRELGRSAELAARGPAADGLRTRRRVEWALGHLARAEASEPGGDFDEHVANALDRLEDAAATVPRADVAGDAAIQLNLGVVALYRGEGTLARDRLLLVAARAQSANDISAYAHAQELLGVAAWMLEHQEEAVVRWQTAARLYADIEEREGQARCLQHLGSAAHVSAGAARLLGRDGNPGGGPPGLRLLEASATLRAGTHGHPVLEHYLKAAHDEAGPEAADSVDRPPPAGLLRRVLRAAGRRGSRRP